MRVVFMGNNQVGLAVLNTLLRDKNTEVVGALLHYGSSWTGSLSKLLNPARTWMGDPNHIVSEMAALEPDIAVSAFYGHILKRPFIDVFPKGVVNLHPALLPWNKGAYPNVWSIADGTPAGVTLHYIDEGIDTGDIIAQVEVKVDPSDTGKTLYHRLEAACVELFNIYWPSIVAGNAPKVRQPPGGSFNRVRDVAAIDKIRLDEKYMARDLINVLRARTFPPYKGAYFEENGRKYYVQVSIEEENHEDR